MALKQGVVDGQENPIATILSGKMYETQKYLSMVNYTYNSTHLLMNKAAFDRLTADQKKVLLEEAVKAGARHAEGGPRARRPARSRRLKKNGMQVAFPDTSALRRRGRSPVYDELKNMVGDAVTTPAYMQLLEKSRK